MHSCLTKPEYITFFSIQDPKILGTALTDWTFFTRGEQARYCIRFHSLICIDAPESLICSRDCQSMDWPQKMPRSKNYTDLSRVIKLAQNILTHPTHLIKGNDSAFIDSLNVLITTAGNELANMGLVKRENAGFCWTGNSCSRWILGNRSTRNVTDVFVWGRTVRGSLIMENHRF